MKQVRLKHVASINARDLPDSTDPDYEFRYIDIGCVGRGRLIAAPERVRFGDAPSRARRLLSPGDTIVSTVRTYLRGVLPLRDSTDDLVVSTGFAVLTPHAGVDPRFLGWWAQSDSFIEEVVARSVGVSYPAVNPSELGRIRVPWLSLTEQRTIADFLDAETARIDGLIEKRRRMAELLDERLERASTALVLTGTERAAVQTKRGRFIPEPPAGWAATQLRHLECEVQTGPFGSQLHAEDYIEGGWPVVNPANLVDGRILPDPSMTVDGVKRTQLLRHALRVGDIVFARRGRMGRAALVGRSEEGWLCGTGSLRIHLGDRRMLPAYLTVLLETPSLRDYFSMASVGSTMENLNAEIVLTAPVLVPSIDEQERIVTQVNLSRTHHEKVVFALRRQIALLQERRQAVITGAVTGQLDVGRLSA